MTSPIWNTTGQFWPAGLPIGQSWLDIGVIFYALQLTGAKSFVEIGINRGGLSAMMYAKTVVEKDFHYYGIEITPHLIDANLPRSNENFTIYVGDIFDNVAWLEHAIRSAKRSIIFCDGGDKAKEMAFVAPLLRPDDVILVHDYTVEWGDKDIPQSLERIVGDWSNDTHLWIGRSK